MKGKNADSDFNARLSRKGHAGNLKFDHEAETLSLSVTRNSQVHPAPSTMHHAPCSPSWHALHPAPNTL